MKTKIYDILRSRTSPAEAITVRQIARSINNGDDGLTHPATRKLIKSMIDEGFPIGSCSKGYFMISTEEDMDAYLLNLYKRVDGILKRIDSLKMIEVD